MKTAKNNQVKNTEALSGKEDELQEQRRLMAELMAEKERLLEEKRELWDMVEAKMKRVPIALQLHLELDLGYFPDEAKEVLSKNGRMKNGISRDFIVPGTMTLHGLHFAIMKAFGWQNSHLHSYAPYKDEFKQMTNGGKVKEWTRQVGMYFRFPSDDYEDQYWDDDYEEGKSVKSWLKSKYCGPYLYGGVGEHYVPAQIEVEHFRKEYPSIQKKTTDQRTWGIYFEGRCEDLLERLMIWSVLKSPADQKDWNSWKSEKEASLKRAENERKLAMKEYMQLTNQMKDIMSKAGACFDTDGDLTIDMLQYFTEIEKYDRKLETLCREHNPEPIPALSALRYRYDYGDGWEIKITCTNAWFDRSVYGRDENGSMRRDRNGFRNGFVPEKALCIDAFGQEMQGEFLDQLKEIAEKEKPVCIAWDGMNLLDDVGGIDGFCEFLEIINGNDPEKKKEYKDWAKSLGWTGRMAKAENIL